MLAGGGHGWDAFEWEGQFGDFAEGVGGQNGKKGKEGRGRKEEVPRVFGEEEGEERETAEDRRDIGYVVHGIWGLGLCQFLVDRFVQIKNRERKRNRCYLHTIFSLFFFFFSLSNTREGKYFFFSF